MGFPHFIGLAGGLLPIAQLSFTAQQTTLQGLEFVSLQLHQAAQLPGWTPRYRCYSTTSNSAQVQTHSVLLWLFAWLDAWMDEWMGKRVREQVVDNQKKKNRKTGWLEYAGQNMKSTFSISAFSKYVPQTFAPPSEGQRFPFGFPSFERAVCPWWAELGQRWQALSVEATLWDTSLPIRGGPLANGRASSLKDELHVAGILTPLVEGHHRVFMWGQVTFCLPPFLDQSISSCAPWGKRTENC